MSKPSNVSYDEFSLFVFQQEEMNAEMVLFNCGVVLEKAGWKSVLKACGEQSVTIVGTAEMQQWCVGNWDTLPLVSGRINQCPVESVHKVYCLTVIDNWLLHSK